MRFLLLAIVLLSSQVQAGYFELGFSGNYRKLYLPTETRIESFDSTVSYTASLAYYFAEMAALELNYTKGQSERFVPSATADSRTTYDFTLAGMDLILTLADRKSNFIPYIKGGLAYFAEKKVTYEFVNNSTGQRTTETVPLDPTFVPSAGFGVKMRLTEAMAFRLGMEAWTSDSINKDPRWDWAGRAGVSWFF